MTTVNGVKRKLSNGDSSVTDGQDVRRGESPFVSANGSRAITVTADQHLSFLLQSLIHIPPQTPFYQDTIRNVVDLCYGTPPHAEDNDEVLNNLLDQAKGYGANEDKLSSVDDAIRKASRQHRFVNMGSKLKTVEEVGLAISWLLEGALDNNEAISSETRLLKLRAWMSQYVLKNDTRGARVADKIPKPTTSPEQHSLNGKGPSGPAVKKEQANGTLEPPTEAPVRTSPASTNGKNPEQQQSSMQVQQTVAPSRKVEVREPDYSADQQTSAKATFAVPLPKNPTIQLQSSAGASLTGVSTPETGEVSVATSGMKSPDAGLNGLIKKLDSDPAVGPSNLDKLITSSMNIKGSATAPSPSKHIPSSPRGRSPHRSSTSELPFDQEYAQRSQALGCWYYHCTPRGCTKSARDCKYSHGPTYFIAPRNPGGHPIPTEMAPGGKDRRRSQSPRQARPLTGRRSASPESVSRTPILDLMWDVRSHPIHPHMKDEVSTAIISFLTSRGYPEQFKTDLGGPDGDYSIQGGSLGLRYKLGFVLCGSGADAETPFRAALSLERVLRPLIKANLKKFTDLPNEAFLSSR